MSSRGDLVLRVLGWSIVVGAAVALATQLFGTATAVPPRRRSVRAR